MATKPTNREARFLRSYLRKLQKYYEGLEELCPQDLLSTNDGPPETSAREELCARLADKHGFDGNLFRNLLPLHPDRSGMDFDILVTRIRGRIETIPRIIAAIESTEAGHGTRPVDTAKPEWTQPMTKILIAEIFNQHRNQVDKLVLNRYAHRQEGRKIRMLVKDMPAGYEQTIENHTRRRGKQNKNSR